VHYAQCIEKFDLTQPCLLQCLVCQGAFHEFDVVMTFTMIEYFWAGHAMMSCMLGQSLTLPLCNTIPKKVSFNACITVPINLIIVIKGLSLEPALSGHAWMVQHRLAFFDIPPSSASSPLCIHHSNSSLGMNYLFLLLTRFSLDLARPRACRKKRKVGIQHHTHIHTPFCITVTSIHHLPRSNYANCSTCTIWGMQQTIVQSAVGHI